MNAIRPHLNILLAAWWQRRNQGSLWVWALIAAMLYIVPAIIYIGGGPPQVFVVATAVLLMCAILFAWATTVQSLRLQNSPSTARLVPGHPGLIRQSLLATWLSMGVLIGVINGLLFGHGWFYGTAALVVMAVVELPMKYRMGVVISVMAPQFFVHNLASTRVGQSVIEQAVYLYTLQPLMPLLVIAAILGVRMARFSVGVGDVRHRKAYERANWWREYMQSMQSGKNQIRHQSGIAWRFTWLTWSPYRWWMHRLLDKTQATPSQVMARAMLGFGPNQHWITQAFITAFIIVLTGLLAALAVATMGLEAARHAIGTWLFPMVIFATSMIVSFLVGQRLSLQQSRREQSLLMLLPGMPRGGKLNRALAAHWLIRFWLTWFVACVLLWSLSQLAQVEPWAIGFAVVSLSASVFLLRDWSSMRFTSTTPTWWAMLGYALAGGGCSWLLYWFELSPWPMMAAVAVLTLIALRWRWTKLGSYRQALPAGRWG